MERAMKLARSSGNSRCIIQVLITSAGISSFLGDFSTAYEQACEAEGLAKLGGDFYNEAHALWHMEKFSTANENFAERISMLIRAKELLRLCGQDGGVLDHCISSQLLQNHGHKTEYIEAQGIINQMLQPPMAEQDPHNYAVVMLNSAEIGVSIGKPADDIRAALGETRNMYAELRIQRGPIYCDVIEADLLLREGDFPGASTLFQECVRSSWGNTEEVLLFALEKLADANRWSSQTPDFTWTVIYFIQAHKTKSILPLYKALRCLGEISLLNGDENTAHCLFTLALEGTTAMGIHCDRAQCMLRLGDLAERRTEFVHAMELWSAARPLFERSLQAPYIAEVDARLSGRHLKSLARLEEIHVPTEAVKSSVDTSSKERGSMIPEQELFLTL
ncbi:hypothetical protein K438DRAFT_569505 [Mycena galopus ATCC 62051]|nr:hypothetical protein K438DRAFT_569505 [Mycena galopus ATCC 62051]